jgi:hypothetical protein
MREKEKKKSNPFLIFTVLLLVAIVATFIIRTAAFTPKESTVSIDNYVPNTEKKSERVSNNNSVDKNQNYRKNWKDFISIATLHKDIDYLVAADGRITNLNLPLINKTDYPIESITIKVNYINPGNSSSMDTRNFEIKNVLPGNRTSYPGPESNVKGVTVMCEIIKIHSSNFDFCYDRDLSIDSQSNGGFSGNPQDPWKCK